MSTEEPKPESPASPATPATTNDAKVEAGSAGDSPPANVDAAVAWPPPEAAPSSDAAAAEDSAEDTAKDASQPSSPTASGNGVPAAVSDSGVMTAPEAKPAPPADDMPAATPAQEMALSNSTLHWLEDGDQAVPTGRLTEPGSMPSYDPRAPVPGRKRGVLVVGLAGVVALIIAVTLYGQAQSQKAAEPPAPAAVEPARDLTTRAEAALAANQTDHALE